MRKVARDEVSFASGLPVTTPERTIFDLVADDEDLSLVADALRSACAGSKPFDFNKLEVLIDGKYGKNKANRILTSLLAGSKALSEGGHTPHARTFLQHLCKGLGVYSPGPFTRLWGCPSPHQAPLTQLTYPCFLHTILSTTPV